MCNHPAHLLIKVFRLEFAMQGGQHVLPTGCEKSLPTLRYTLLLGFHKLQHKQIFSSDKLIFIPGIIKLEQKYLMSL